MHSVAISCCCDVYIVWSVLDVSACMLMRIEQLVCHWSIGWYASYNNVYNYGYILVAIKPYNVTSTDRNDKQNKWLILHKTLVHGPIRSSIKNTIIISISITGLSIWYLSVNFSNTLHSIVFGSCVDRHYLIMLLQKLLGHNITKP